jgi:hypothetical protein
MEQDFSCNVIPNHILSFIFLKIRSRAGVTQAVEHLPCKCKALSTNKPQYYQKKKIVAINPFNE